MVRDHFSEVVDRVEHEHDRVTVTRNGRPAAVILGPDDLAQLEETLEILSDPEALTDIREADAPTATAMSCAGLMRSALCSRDSPVASGSSR